MLDYIDTEILREIQRKLFLRQLELRLDCIFDRAISNFQRKLNQGLKELFNARVAKVEDASVETEIEESSLDSECTTIAETNINHDASVFTQLQLSPDVTSSKPELIEPIEESQLEEPNVNINLEAERHSKVDEIISENPKATFLRFEEISLQGQHHFKP
ncbi:auxin-responsive family protein [Corchorus olitorius]|uniref:Auxin-responsive family protein n=1 Tax=Corchorus olitorius TaxID=93759 RepID=A0A1R3GXD7_9ROSI|nr:auxin-responsive family protein [Corchorus olitorius]